MADSPKISNVVNINVAKNRPERRASKIRPTPSLTPNADKKLREFVTQEQVNGWIDAVLENMDVLEHRLIISFVKKQDIERRIPKALVININLQLEEVLADIYGVSPLELANLDVEHDAEMFQETLSKLPRGDSPLAEELENVPYSAAIEMQEYFVEYMRGLIHTSRTLSILKKLANDEKSSVSETIRDVFEEMELAVDRDERIVAFDLCSPRMQREIVVTAYFDELPRLLQMVKTAQLEHESTPGKSNTFEPIAIKGLDVTKTYPVRGHLYLV
jgi:hypothetical protein